MKTVAAAMMLAASLTVAAAPATVVTAAPAHAIGGAGASECKKAAHRYLRDPSYAVPPNCWNSYYFHALGITLPGDGALPPPPDDGAAPRPDEPAPPTP